WRWLGGGRLNPAAALRSLAIHGSAGEPPAAVFAEGLAPSAAPAGPSPRAARSPDTRQPLPAGPRPPEVGDHATPAVLATRVAPAPSSAPPTGEALISVGAAASRDRRPARPRAIATAVAILWAALFLADTTLFLSRFFGPFNREPERVHVNHVDLLEACAWLRPRPEGFD